MCAASGSFTRCSVEKRILLVRDEFCGNDGELFETIPAAVSGHALYLSYTASTVLAMPTKRLTEQLHE